MLHPAGLPRPAHFGEHIVQGRAFRVARWYADPGSAARPLLFFTGIGANIELLAPFLERLRGRDVVTFDMPGVGGSSLGRRAYRLSAMADAAERIVADLGYGKVDVMGVSWGGMLAQEYAFRHRHSAARLVLAATSPGMPMIPGSLSTLVKMASSQRYVEPWKMGTYLQSLYGGSAGHLETYASRMRPPSSRGYLYQLLAIAGWTSVRKLTQVSAKTLILMGDEDKLLPPVNGQILKFLIDDARLEILEDAGHLFVLTHLETVAPMIEAFLTE